jgi:hypothetical protein
VRRYEAFGGDAPSSGWVLIAVRASLQLPGRRPSWRWLRAKVRRSEADKHDAVDVGVGRGQVVEPAAVLGLAEAFLDAGALPEPGFQRHVVPVVGRDVGDQKADSPDVVATPLSASASWSLSTVRRRRERGSLLSLSTGILTRRMMV